jgi:hypothetical protein
VYGFGISGSTSIRFWSFREHWCKALEAPEALVYGFGAFKYTGARF